MKISYKWLLELTGVDWPVQEVADRLTLCGTACEEIIPVARHMDKVVVGEVLDLKPIEGADKIRRATVSIGTTTFDLVCGAPNVAVGQKVPVATLGAELAGGLVIRKAKIRGIESAGMICSPAELGLSDDHSGIMVLDTSAVPGTPLVEALDVDDYILGFELTPNRADSMSAVGIARDLAALAGVRLKRPSYELNESAEKSADHISITIENPADCYRFTARIIKNVKIGPSPWWVRKRLLASGMRPISNVVDITNLVMLETGNPMHAFDLEQFGSHEVVIRRAKAGERFTTLDGKEHQLSTDNLMVTNGRECTGIAGVMGGLHSEVTDRTKTLFLEVACFDPQVVRRSRRHVGMVTESSQRFEKGVDPNAVAEASNRAAALFQDLCGGEVLGGLVDVYPRKIPRPVITMRPERCNAIMGRDYPVARMKEILELLEFEVSGESPITATVPTFRYDMSREIDLIEEVGRIEGYASLPDAIGNSGSLFTPTHAEDRFVDDLRRTMVAAGFDEMMGHGLAHSKAAAALDPAWSTVHIVNPVTEELDIMRPSLIVSALPVVAHNIAHRNLDLRLFEIGKVYSPPDPKGEWHEPEHLLILVTGQTAAGWREKPRVQDFYDITGALKNLGLHFHLSEFTFESLSRPYLTEGQAFQIKLGDTVAGEIGRLDDTAAKKFDIKQEVFLAELTISSLIAGSAAHTEFQPLPVYPAATRDIAMIVDRSTRAGEIVARIKSTIGSVAESVELFDLYVGKQIAEGRKSIAVAIRYRSPERSLESSEVDTWQEDVMAMLRQEFKAEIRDK
jgi:phenylalanyl-tRNA synthetase beta chain